ncbi:mapkkk cascade protein kinase regulator ste50 [Histomonas meleagridis]|uniref:mapkkk cascade protein kinase regulator ste50 n=1 Tax=Histomonas meleagridis TaxID=135588 RepID=UPI00355A2D33|nr:mapkkk cascade protein kinase regulator ste50 [Histomonas meleagridis]KAH0797723.1 mapkkk cascade protein kinase regulator ste50 [Histomonas meleagridis]
MNYQDWNQQDVAKQLKLLGYGQYANAFIQNEICGIHLPLITEDHLKEMGVTSIGHRILMMRRFSDIVNGKITKPASSTPTNDDTKSQQKDNSRQTTPITSSVKPKSILGQSNSTTSKELTFNLNPKTNITSSKHDLTTSDQPTKPTLSTNSRFSSTEIQVSDPTDELITCQYCGRKYQPDAAKRHIPVCGRINGRNRK